MARIIYGVCGEGMGHAIRSKLLLDHLSKKHEIKIFSSRGAFSFLSKHFEDVQEVQGLSIAYRNNRVSKIETVFHNILNVFGLIRSFREVKAVMDRFKPDIIISDYEIISAYAALVRRVPLVSVDNQHIIKGKISFPKKFIREYIETVIVNRINIPAAKHYIVTSFFKPEKTQKAVDAYQLCREEKEKAGLSPENIEEQCAHLKKEVGKAHAQDQKKAIEDAGYKLNPGNPEDRALLDATEEGDAALDIQHLPAGAQDVHTKG